MAYIGGFMVYCNTDNRDKLWWMPCNLIHGSWKPCNAKSTNVIIMWWCFFLVHGLVSRTCIQRFQCNRFFQINHINAVKMRYSNTTKETGAPVTQAVKQSHISNKSESFHWTTHINSSKVSHWTLCGYMYLTKYRKGVPTLRVCLRKHPYWMSYASEQNCCTTH